MANPFVHVELSTTDIAKAKVFYQNLFSWNLQEMPMHEGPSYTMIHVGEGTGGGMIAQTKTGLPSSWLPYVMVDDINKAVERAKSLGATIKVQPAEVKDMGWYAVIADPTGAALGLWMSTAG